MKRFLFTNKSKLGTSGIGDDDHMVKLAGSRATVRYIVTAATNLVLCVKLAIRPEVSQFTEIYIGSDYPTRKTFTAAGSDHITIDGLTPDMYIAVDVVSGSGTFTWEVLTSE